MSLPGGWAWAKVVGLLPCGSVWGHAEVQVCGLLSGQSETRCRVDCRLIQASAQRQKRTEGSTGQGSKGSGTAESTSSVAKAQSRTSS